MMGEKAVQITRAFHDIIKLNREIRKLLSMADEFMKKNDWKLWKGNHTRGNSSESLERPESWLPQYYYRGYVKDSLRNIIVYVSVITHERENPNGLQQAVITTGWYEGKDTFNPKDWYIWSSCAFVHSENQEALEPVEINVQKPEVLEWHKGSLTKGYVFGLPLDEVSTTAELELKIIKPLLAGIAKCYE